MVRPATQNIARRAETTSAGRPVRAPVSAAPAAYSAVASATIRAAVPTSCTAGSDLPARGRALRELRRALGDQRVALPQEAPAGELSGDDDLAPVAERVGDGAAVDHGHGRAMAAAVAHAE